MTSEPVLQIKSNAEKVTADLGMATFTASLC